MKPAGIVTGAAIGALCTSFGLIDTTLGAFRATGGNEWTPFVTGTGGVVGGIVGSTAFFRRYFSAFVFAGVGLVFAILIRDEWMLEPPLVLADLFGLPVLGALVGAGIEMWRRRGMSSTVGAVLVVVAVPLISIAMLALVRSHDFELAPGCAPTEVDTSCVRIPLRSRD